MRQFAGATAKTMQNNGNDQTGMAGMFANMFSQGGNQSSMPPPPARQHEQQTMNGPSNIDNILNEIENYLWIRNIYVYKKNGITPLG